MSCAADCGCRGTTGGGTRPFSSLPVSPSVLLFDLTSSVLDFDLPRASELLVEGLGGLVADLTGELED